MELQQQDTFEPSRIDCWIVVNFIAHCDTSHISRELINSGRKKGILIEHPLTLLDEEPQSRRQIPVIRVEKIGKILIFMGREKRVSVISGLSHNAFFLPRLMQYLTNLKINSKNTPHASL
ncbi:hypothetical protein ACLB2K_058493 [Fragaria x ananassa]